MLRLSTTLILLLATLFCLGESALAGNPAWPLKGTIDLSSGFGDYRFGHFHFGIDLRTGGQIGKKVFSPVDGYVSRVRTAYDGYGKALYITDNTGNTYVFAHLDSFADKIDNSVRSQQLRSQRYYLDHEFAPENLPVKKGELVARSGKTGSGAPHLHFERRNPDGLPVNPLTNGFKLKDRIRPTFTRIGFQMGDDRALFADGSRVMFYDVIKGKNAGEYTLDTVLYFSRPFGLLAECFDQMRVGGMKQAAYDVRVLIDGEEHYRSTMSQVDWETNHAVALEYDIVQAERDRRKRVRRLYTAPGNVFDGSGGPGDGFYGRRGAPTFGLHTGEIIATDAFGNTSTLTFRFLWGPSDIFVLDSTESVKTDTNRITTFELSAVSGWKSLGLDSVQVMLNVGPNWVVPPDIRTLTFDSGKVQCVIEAYRTEYAVLRVVAYSRYGCVIPDLVFNGIQERGTGRPVVQHQVLDDGLLVAIHTDGKLAGQARVELYYRDSLLGIEFPPYFHMNTHLCFIPPDPRYRRIDRILVALTHDREYKGVTTDSVNIACVGFESDPEWLAVDDHLSIRVAKDNLYQPRYVEFIKTIELQRWALGLHSDYYQILPEVFATRSEFEMRYKYKARSLADSLAGLCWLDQRKDRFVWLENVYDNRTVTCKSAGGGTFASVIDDDAPEIKPLTVTNRTTTYDPMHEIRFQVEDTLSGIADDRSIVIKLDGDWLIPEYDPEAGILRTRPNRPMSPGKHHLALEVTDRAGNRSEQYFNFNVRSKKK